MWIAKIKLKHNCILGNRCKEFKVILQSLELTERKEKGKILTTSLHQMVGKTEQIKKFIADLQKDKRTEHLEVSGNTIFLEESATQKPVSVFMKNNLFVTKPVLIDVSGFEYWEVASHNKEEIMHFIRKVKSFVDEFTLQSVKNTPLQNVYFPKLMPSLTELQKQALELAVQEGYYQAPKKIGLRQLAKMMKISVATYQKHLQKAESKVIPDVLSFLK
ncbi:helix-turn-helix domain-containing protein [Candidatus Woesearchaeota archaeon]|nr:helix-turn-helix domain-containing protein [Candidatus Woesearchaeota archaeon]